MTLSLLTLFTFKLFKDVHCLWLNGGGWSPLAPCGCPSSLSECRCHAASICCSCCIILHPLGDALQHHQQLRSIETSPSICT